MHFSLDWVWIFDIISPKVLCKPKSSLHKMRKILKGYRECHIEPDWLLIYRIENDILVLTLSRTGTHSDLFNK